MALTEEQTKLLRQRGFLPREKEGSSLSKAELERRDLLKRYNRGEIDEEELEGELLSNFRVSLISQVHERNMTKVDSSEKLRLYIAKRSRRYRIYLLKELPLLARKLDIQPVASKIGKWDSEVEKKQKIADILHSIGYGTNTSPEHTPTEELSEFIERDKEARSSGLTTPDDLALVKGMMKKKP